VVLREIIKKMYNKNYFTFVVALLGFYQLVAVPVSLIYPCYNNVPRAGLVDQGASRSSFLVNMDNRTILAAARNADLLDSHRIEALCLKLESGRIEVLCREEVDIQLQKERNRNLRSLLIRYVEVAHLFGDEGLAAAIQEQHKPFVLEDDEYLIHDAGQQICVVDSSVVLNQVVHEILNRYSFETLDGVSAAIKELEREIHGYGLDTHKELVRDLQSLNSEPLSASYHCMKKVSRILAQLPPESSQAIRNQFPWYLQRMI